MRIAIFNVENLFSRAKVLNLDSRVRTGEILAKIGQLEDLLQAPVYDKATIFQLYEELKTYIEIDENKGKLFKKSGQAIVGIAANGVADWDGSIQFKRADFSEQTRISTAEVIKSLKADIQCLVEVEDRPAMNDFGTDLIASKFAFNMCIDGNDPRGIDVGVYSKFPIENIKTNIFLKQGRSKVFSRDCLELTFKLPNGKNLFLLLNHFKSKMNNNAAADARRRNQADMVKSILTQRYDLINDFVVVAGDFNDTPDSAVLQSLLSTPNLTDVLELKFGPYQKNHPDRWTYKFKNEFNQIDFILVSKPLKDVFKDAGMERRGLFGIAGNPTFASVVSKKTSASDHAAVWADFNL